MGCESRSRCRLQIVSNQLDLCHKIDLTKTVQIHCASLICYLGMIPSMYLIPGVYMPGCIPPAKSLMSVALSYQVDLLRMMVTSKEHTEGLHQLELLRSD
jgi:hypothetical protein